jgi:hypothetical protein
VAVVDNVPIVELLLPAWAVKLGLEIAIEEIVAVLIIGIPKPPLPCNQKSLALKSWFGIKSNIMEASNNTRKRNFIF